MFHLYSFYLLCLFIEHFTVSNFSSKLRYLGCKNPAKLQMKGMGKAWLVFHMYSFQRKHGSVTFCPQVLTQVPPNVLSGIFHNLPVFTNILRSNVCQNNPDLHFLFVCCFNFQYIFFQMSWSKFCLLQGIKIFKTKCFFGRIIKDGSG